MEDTKSFMIQQSKISWIVMVSWGASTLHHGVFIRLIPWQMITQARPNQPWHRLWSVSCTGEGSSDFSEGLCMQNALQEADC